MNAAYFRIFARYNRWANQRLYDACAQLPPGEIAKARSSFFGSILNTLNHLLVVDRVWLGRLEGRDSGVRSLDEIPFHDFAELRRARETEDGYIVAHVDSLTDADLADDLRFATLAGEARSMPRFIVLGHMFNHQTHHRGQVHGLLSQTEAEPPPLDLAYFDWRSVE